ncbi:MAG: cyclic di-AMP binding protein CbpA [Lactobacillaceae bacterium]|jgi:CBS domain-containing protein|nr:cyclic di-AMP binding protein CbpA [Lactobacillaceae bacterium]
MLASLIKHRAELTTVTEDATIQNALDLLNETSFRAIPILDESGQLFRGAIYKMHIYRHQAEQGDMHLPVTALMRNMTKFINEDATFFETLFSLRDLPFISVLDNNNHFIGILTHSRLMEMMADSWITRDGKYTLTLLTDGTRGSLESAAKYISRYTNISSSITLNPDNNHRTERLIVTLPDTISEDTLSKIIRVLSRKGFHLESLEELDNISYL